jgi:hypothetical protein
MEAAMVLAPSTRVEISGWDTNSKFFVEKASLQAGTGEHMQARMQHRTNVGTLLFVRALDRPRRGEVWPLAFRVVQSEWNESQQLYDVELKEVEVQH